MNTQKRGNLKKIKNVWLNMVFLLYIKKDFWILKYAYCRGSLPLFSFFCIGNHQKMTIPVILINKRIIFKRKFRSLSLTSPLEPILGLILPKIALLKSCLAHTKIRQKCRSKKTRMAHWLTHEIQKKIWA